MEISISQTVYMKSPLQSIRNSVSCDYDDLKS